MTEVTVSQVCAVCLGWRIYDVEFRTDSHEPRTFSPMNEGMPEEESPYRMGGPFCLDCSGFVNIRTVPEHVLTIPDPPHSADTFELPYKKPKYPTPQHDPGYVEPKRIRELNPKLKL
jgi:hypothetical protein